MNEEELKRVFSSLSEYCNSYGDKKGFNKLFRRILPAYRPFVFLNLMHDELSEASEYARDDNMDSFSNELAGLLFRIFHVCGFYNIDIAQRFLNECKRNKIRPKIHGRKII